MLTCLSCCVLFHWKATPTRAFNEFLYEFLGIFLIPENSLKFAIFFAEVTNSRSMALLCVLWRRRQYIVTNNDIVLAFAAWKQA